MKISYEDKIVLTDYPHIFKKAEHDFERYKSNYGLYELTDCLLTLNSLPEWIQASEKASSELKTSATQIINTMRSLELDELKLDQDIYQKLRLVRLFSNHVKHAKSKEKIPKIVTGFALAQTLPASFTNIQVGELCFDSERILEDIFSFWKHFFQDNSL